MSGPLPEPLAAALRVQAEAAAEGFDWPDMQGLWDKLAEEIEELRLAKTEAEKVEEVGDLLFTVVNLARRLGVDPSAALSASTAKFTARYAYVMADAAALPAPGSAGRLPAMEARWQAAKRLAKPSAASLDEQ